MLKKTQKIYYDKPYKSSIEATVTDIKDNGIVLDKTIAYPEGGGQEGDRGVLIVDGEAVEFYDTQKGLGRTIYLDDFPTIAVDNPIMHYVKDEDVTKFEIGKKVTVKIDTIRRARLSISHSAAHIALMGVEKYFPKMEDKIYGAKIKEDSARLDFRTTYKFSQDDIAKIKDYANDVIAKNEGIEIFRHPKEPEALYWRLDWYTCPCGGTHIDNTSYIKSIKVKRKNLGKNGQRISINFEVNDLFQEKFHEK
jgi:alanyl-tRNA synthetase